MQAENIHIRNGRLIDPKNGIDRQADVFVAEGTVCAVGRAPAGFATTRVIDATGRIVCPGLVDLSARLPALDSELVAADVADGFAVLLSCRLATVPPARLDALRAGQQLERSLAIRAAVDFGQRFGLFEQPERARRRS